uniref:CSC1/OSCA1-like N-terminal transmembrane domain-containing protein n=1 Tax=Nelumbo nucifera TaxID=4432 RepID=A0A822ZF17_NELNU|nr:TPA_asm: hypothetical protein HUJ06_015909 [Nelumbo nucifera]
MKVSALLTSAGINIGMCVLLLSLYSVLRKQPANVCVYFGRRLAQENIKRNEFICLKRLVPSLSWILKAWETSEDEILAIGGLDAVVFFRILVFSIRVFSIAATVCILLVLPLNYYGQEMHHKNIPSESLDVFTIANVKEGSKCCHPQTLFGAYLHSKTSCIIESDKIKLRKGHGMKFHLYLLSLSLSLSLPLSPLLHSFPTPHIHFRRVSSLGPASAVTRFEGGNPPIGIRA